MENYVNEKFSQHKPLKLKHAKSNYVWGEIALNVKKLNLKKVMRKALDVTKNYVSLEWR